MAVKPVPDGYHTVTPYLIVRDAAKAIAFYKQAFGATELMRFEAPGGGIMHAELRIGDSPVMLADEHPQMNAYSPAHYGGSAVHMLIYVEDVDTRFDIALKAGAKVMKPVADQLYGDRTGTLVDPFGHQWTIATHIEDVSLDEVKKRYETAGKQQSS